MLLYTFSVLLRVDDIDLVHIEVDIALCLRAEQSAVVRVLHNGIDIPHAALKTRTRARSMLAARLKMLRFVIVSHPVLYLF